MAETVDELLRKFGDPGRYQLVVLALMWTVMCSLALNNLISLFTVRDFPHHCKLPDNSPWTKNESIPMSPSGEYESCIMYQSPSNHSLGTIPCSDGWEHYPTEPFEWTIVQEWDLVCDRHYLSALATSLYFAGVMVGALAFGYLSDRIGRKPVMLISMYAQIVVGIGIHFSVSYKMYVFLRFLHGFILQGTFAASYAIAIELFQPHRRSAIAIATQSMWPIMILILTLFAYWLGNWRSIHLAVTLPALITTTYYWLVPESPRWLLSVQKTKRTHEELVRLSQRNHIPLPSDLENEIVELTRSKKGDEKDQSFGVKDFFRQKRLGIIFAVTCYTHFVAVINFYGIAFSVPNLGENPYVGFGMGGLIELVVIFIMYFFLTRFGRKQVAIGCMLACATFTLLTFILQIVSSSSGVTWLYLTTAVIAFLARAIDTAYFTVMPIYSNELYPTVLRTLGNGFCNFFGRIGGMIVPQIVLLRRYAWEPLPFLIFTVISLLAAFFTIFLPETRNKPLPEFPEDVYTLWEDSDDQSWRRKKKKNFQNGTLEEADKLTLEIVDKKMPPA